MIVEIVNYFKNNRRRIVSIGISIAIIIIITLIFHRILNYHASTVYVKRISSFGEMYKNTIENKIEDYTSEAIYLKGDSDILSLNKEKVSKRVEFLKYYHTDYKDIIVIDLKGSIYSGYVSNVKEYMYQDYIQEALKGNITTSKPINIQGEWYIDFASPVGEDNKVIGVISLRVGLNDFIQDISPKTGNNIEVLIVDEHGSFIAGNAGSTRVIGEDSINIRSIKTSIDYSPKTPYKNIDGIYVYGVYSDLDIGNWTMICEVENNRFDMYTVLLIITLINTFLIILINKLIGLPCRVTLFKRK